VNRPALRRWMAAELVGLPAPGVASAANAPVARRFANAAGASDAAVESDLARLPSVLDRVDRLIDEGTIGSEAPNAADCQIASAVRVLLEFPDLAPAIADRPAGVLARRLFADYPGPFPARFPSRWLEPIAPGA